MKFIMATDIFAIVTVYTLGSVMYVSEKLKIQVIPDESVFLIVSTYKIAMMTGTNRLFLLKWSICTLQRQFGHILYQ